MQREDILHLASLARIELSEEEIQRFPDEIGEIVDFVSKVQELATGDEVVRDMRNYNSFRDDVVHSSDDRDRIIDGFPERDGDYLQVPKIISN
ncbi:MAG: Asp-tRNA(Asn)/Glu-tRNA(Gln) amidotransferase subunit GatC [Patescibacteria group bacterium]